MQSCRHLALPCEHHRGAGLWIPSKSMRLPECAVGSFEVSHPQAYLAYLVVGLGRVQGEPSFHFRAGATGLALRIRPRPAQSQEFRPMHTADARPPSDRLSLAPPAGRLRPLAAHRKLACFAIGADGVAVHDAGCPWTQLPANGCSARLVKKWKPFMAAADDGQAHSEPGEAHRDEIRAAEPVADIDGFAEQLGTFLQLAGAERQ